MTSATPPVQFRTLADAYREALRLDALGHYAEARRICQQILKQSDGHAEVYHLLGVISLHERRPDDAITHLKRALKLNPNLTEAAVHLSIVYREQGRWREYLTTLETVHALQPAHTNTLVDMGYAHEMLNEPDPAVARYRQAIALDPAAAMAHSNLAAMLIRRGALAEADHHLNAALAAKPDDPMALMNLAMLHEAAGERDKAVATYDRVLQTQPDHLYAPFQRSLALMAQGHLADGFASYACRFRRPESQTLHGIFPLPYWQGEPLAGRKLLVWTEQGPGDEILIASMLPDLLAAGADLTLICSPRMAPLFARSFPACTVISNTRLKTINVTAFDVQASLSELGRYLRPNFTAFPARRRYLIADPVLVQKLRAGYQAGSADKLVGIAWHSANPSAAMQKSTALESWAPILAIPGMRFVNLQYGEHRKDAKTARDAAGREIIADNTIDPLKDMDRFAAQVAAMDHVVSVSNTTVHVAGALDVPTFTLVPAGFGRIWYWFLDRSDSPWYPSIKLFRQQATGDWTSIIADVAGDLRRTLGITA